MALATVSLSAAVITTPTLITESDFTFDGTDLVISDTVVIIDGAHSFSSIVLTNHAVITHSSYGLEMHRLDLVVSNQIVVSSDSKFDASGKGFLPGFTIGNVTNGAATGSAGGSHAGRGAGPTGVIYGDYAHPFDAGAGSGTDNCGGFCGGSPGGGVIKIKCASLVLDGLITVDGGDGNKGGAGGSIWISTEQIAGVGYAQARGGIVNVPSYRQFGGGGGRIAIYTSSYAGFDISHFNTSGGFADNGWGGSGTVYLRNPGELSGMLIIGTDTGTAGITPLGLSESKDFIFPDKVVLRGPVNVVAEHAGMTFEFQNDLTLDNNAVLKLEPTAAVFMKPPLIQNNARLEILGSYAATVPFVFRTNGQVRIMGDLLLSTPWQLESGLAQVMGAVTSTVPVVVAGGTLSMDRLVAPTLILTNGGVLACPDSSIQQMHSLEVLVTGDIVVAADSRINVNGKGYVQGRTKGNTLAGGAIQDGAGSYGGFGGGNFPNKVYGDYADPNEWGSSGADGSPGGGQVRVTARNILLNGQIHADGSGGLASGSGGSVWINAQILSGTGGIHANGGGGNRGGGGGRVAVYGADSSSFDTNSIQALGGGGNAPGGAGTVHIVNGGPHTHVRSFSPSGQNGGFVGNELPGLTNRLGYINAPIGFAKIEFNRSVQTNLFLQNLSIAGPLGQISVTNLGNADGSSYSIAFPEQTANGTYRFFILPRLVDTEGFGLDQDGDGQPGEPLDDLYSFKLVVDTVSPHVVQHTPSGDVAGTIQSVDVWFSEGMDAKTVSSKNLSILNPTNGIISVSSIQEVGLSRFRISFSPQTMLGIYHVLVSTNLTDLAGNNLLQDVSLPAGINYDGVFNLVPVDLEVSELTSSTNAISAGDTLSVSWQGRNILGSSLIGSWTDAVYFSPDPFWNITDTLVGSVQHTNGLASNEAYKSVLDFAVPGVLPGTYYVIVRADVGNQAREANETNNVAVFGPVSVTVREIATGSSVSGTLTPNNRLQYYAIHIPRGESLRLKLEGQSGVNHLFVNFASIPTRLNSDASATMPNANQILTLTGLSDGGTYYVLVSGEQLGNGIYSLTAETAPFFINSITPSQIAGGRSTRFWVEQIESSLPLAILSGEGFDKDTTVEFIGLNSGTTQTPSKIELISPSVLHLHLTLTKWTPDSYNVQVTKGSNIRVLTNAFTLTGDGEAKLDARIVGTMLSEGGGQTLYVEYANTGTRPMPAPLLKVTAYTNAVIVTHRLNRRAQDRLYAPGGISGGGGGGGGGLSIPSYRFRVAMPLNTAEMMAVGPGPNPGVLMPGDRGRVPVYFEGVLHNLGDRGVQFSVGSLTADDTTIVNCGSPAPGIPDEIHFPRTGERRLGSIFAITNQCPEILFAPNWTELEQTSKPETVDFSAWHAVWQNLTNSVGPLWPDYLIMLGDNMNHLAKVGQLTNDPAVLFNFEILQASAALNPVRTLASAIDASAPSPGFPLVFRRVYNQPILSRYRLGPLGRGWTHNWDISVQSLTNFQGALVRGPGGSERFFGRYNNNTFTATSGDTGSLTQTNGLFRLAELDGTVWQFNEVARPDYVQDANGNRITCVYTANQLTGLRHSSGKELVLEYDAAGMLETLTDPLGPGPEDDRVTVFEYNGEFLERVTAPGNRVTSYGYYKSGSAQRLYALTNVVHPDLSQEVFEYDERGRLHETAKNGNGQRIVYDYDSAGSVIVTDATQRKTQLLYGLGGQLAQVRDGEGRVVNFGYNDFAQLTQLIGPGGERYRYAYDDLGNLSAIENPLRQTNRFSFEPSVNRLRQVTDARGNPLSYSYDLRGNLTNIVRADNTSESFGYDASGNVTSTTNRRGGVINFRYNYAGQLTNKWYMAETGRVDFYYAYDIVGNLTNATYFDTQLGRTADFKLTYYPELQTLHRIEYPTRQWFEYSYDAIGRRTGRTDQDGNLTAYVYDAVGRLDRMTNGLGQVIVDYDYDDAGRLQRKTLGNGVYSTNHYNSSGQIIDLVNRRADHSLLSSFSYTYDASGRRDSMTTLAGTETYGYDPLGQLTSVAYPNGRVVTYAYDAAGNRTQVIDNGVPTAYSANMLNQYTSVGGTNYQFDADGNQTNQFSTINPALSTRFTYDNENRLIGISTPTDAWLYFYDAFGNRIAATHNGESTRYVIDPTGLGNLVAEHDGGGGLIARYEYGFGLLARSDTSGRSSYYTFSAVGHTSELTDPAGAVANAYAYDPFGLSLAKTDTVANPFEYVGEFGVMEEANGLDFMRARFYDPSIGRFLQEDPIGVIGGMNTLSYAVNNPTTKRDPSGLKSDDFSIIIRNMPTQGPSLGNPKYSYSYFWDDQVPQAMDDLFVGTFAALLITMSGHDLEEIDPTEIIHADDLLKEMPEMLPELIESGKSYLEDSKPLLPWLWQVSAPVPFPLFIHDQQSWSFFRSVDPNDKLGPAGYGSPAYLAANTTLPYQIRFGNQPSATAPAQRVAISDALDPNLDLSTFELTEIAFANQTFAIPSGLNHYEARLAFSVTNQTLAPLSEALVAADQQTTIVVDINAQLDVQTRLITVNLTTLDPITDWTPENPLIGLLYPNDNTGRGNGSVSYIVRSKADLPSGTAITNRANIVFDYNDPILTPIVSNTIDSVAPSSSIASLSPEEFPQFSISWTASDDQFGSGIKDVAILVSENGSEYFEWLKAYGAGTASFEGQFGHAYDFKAVARDNVGNVQATPISSQAKTRIVSEPLHASEILRETNGAISFNVLGFPAGHTLIVLFTQSLTEPNWQPLAGSVSGGIWTQTEPIPDSPTGFFQLIAQ